MPEKTASLRISQDVIHLLMDRGMTVTDISRALKLSKSYISRVKSGTRSFTLDHLMELERVVGEPVPLLLMQAIPRDLVPAAHQHLYDATLNLLKGRPLNEGIRSRAPSKRGSRPKAA